MKSYVIASNNSGKIKEINNFLANKNITVIPQASLNISDIPETGLTFIENALIKARHASREANLPALADDSGLVVPCLNGEPGLYSARYAGTNNNTDNINKLISKLKNLNIDHSNIPAYFYCVLVLLQHAEDPSPIVAEGRWHGHIILEPRGEHGFGYDPVFLDPELMLTAAEMSLEQKQARSHRGQALKTLESNIDNQAKA